MNKEKFEKDMAAFSFNQHQDVLTYLTHLKAKGWTIKDAQEWVERERKRLAQPQKGHRAITKECPLCQSFMRLLPINFTPATLTGDGSKSVWLCPKKDCMNTIYNKESIEEITKKGGN